ncbi:uncharacterized protein Pyn_36139 [Prunus yedoensis var. nudiflora]|uniref:NECAP PHear domain-containing protein n=1 Tax=Prunus yedoensis var. nudiflora TaxID=2094558 RepID=A0A314YEL6_PRUYE|nr:uncharacterized protein Pyn_36139 [Prunus yedoensis var. nudiflora]
MSFEDEEEAFEHTLLVVREVARALCRLLRPPGPARDLRRDRARLVAILRAQDRGRHGKHAFIGLGFAERNEAFDFNVALSDHEKYVKREHEKESNGGETSDDGHIDIHPAVNHRLKEGETIRINVKPKPTSGTGMLSAAGLSGTVKPKPISLGLAPPPGAGKVRIGSGGGVQSPPDNPRRSSDPLSDLSQIERNLPSATGSGSTKTTAAGWAAF